MKWDGNDLEYGLVAFCRNMFRATGSWLFCTCGLWLYIIAFALSLDELGNVFFAASWCALSCGHKIMDYDDDNFACNVFDL